jgi:hypothetical protein
MFSKGFSGVAMMSAAISTPPGFLASTMSAAHSARASIRLREAVPLAGSIDPNRAVVCQIEFSIWTGLPENF